MPIRLGWSHTRREPMKAAMLGQLQQQHAHAFGDETGTLTNDGLQPIFADI